MAARIASFQPRFGGLLALAALCAFALGLAACGGGSSDTPDIAKGKVLFTGTCGGCHTLADAGTTGIVGPNLDDAFRASRKEGFEPSSFEGLVKYWIANPQQRTKPMMPPNLLTGQDAANVAAYIAAVAGTNEESPARPSQPGN
jgi:mono/diheme cytochrome c family protein